MFNCKRETDSVLLLFINLKFMKVDHAAILLYLINLEIGISATELVSFTALRIQLKLRPKMTSCAHQVPKR
jgi:hypothetical protein